MTIINPNSISGITSVTAEAGVMNFYKSDGTLAGLQLNGVNFNTTAGVSTFNNLYVGGTITYEDVKNVDSVGIITARAGIKVPDDQIIRLGAANDLDIYHTTSGTSWIRHGNTSEYFVIEGNQMDFRSYTNSHYRVRMGTAVELRHNNIERFKTSSTGVTITGIPVATQNTGNVGLELHATGSGRGSQTKYHNDHGEAYIGQAGDTTGELLIHNTTASNINIATGNANRIKIAGSSAATSIGGAMTFNAMLTTQGDVSGGLLMLKAAENTNRLFVSGNDSNGVEINLYDGAGGQKGILGVSGSEFFIKAPNNSAPLTFYTHNGSSIGERLRITSDGKIGINNNAPLYAMHFKNAMSSSPSWIHMEVTGSNTEGGGGGIAFDTSASNADSNNSLFLATVSGERSSSNNGSNSLVFKTSKSGVAGDSGTASTPRTAMVITENLNVGIGSTIPTNALDVQAGTTNTAIVARSTDSKAQISLLDNSTTSVGSVVIGAEGNALFLTSGSGGTERLRINSSGTAQFKGNIEVDTGSAATIDFGDITSAYGRLYADSTGTFIGSKSNHALILRTNNTERLRITTAGNVIPGSNNATNIGDGSTNFNSIWASTRFRGNDNVKLVLGNSQDLVIRHDGSNNIIGSPVGGNLQIKAGTGDNDNELCATFNYNGAVELYTNNFKAFSTNTAGINLWGPEGGDCVIDMFADEGDDNADAWRIAASQGGSWYLKNLAPGSWDTMIAATVNTGVELFYDNNKRIKTTTTGMSITRQNAGEYFNVNANYGASGDQAIETSGDLTFYTNGSSIAARLDQDGLKFNANTAAANALDDYEEGSFNMTVTPGGGSYSYGYGNTGYYVKIGKLVHINVWIHLSPSSVSGGITLGGLPFTVKNTNRRQRVQVTGYGWSSISNSSIIMARLSQNGTTADMSWTNNSYSSTTTVTAGNLGQSSEIYINAAYITEN